ncbi:prostate and testis expressed protein 2-like [Antechinus flavipes]|uniref:prostate and testis expressed protein 2-like n=1 Tax=Antechinus flavipes TaxID=38775 RepID=UPI0022360A4A|nr:prostate and testis expressed protein 2-like [Antechinus flavipes]
MPSGHCTIKFLHSTVSNQIRHKMNKLFLLSFSLLCLLNYGEPEFFMDKEENFLLCAVCERFRRGVCYEGNNFCISKSEKGCRSQSYYSYSENGGEYTHSVLDCAEICGKSIQRYPGKYVLNRCCGENNCNKKISLA